MFVGIFLRKISILLPVVLAVGILVASHAYAQTSGATLSGTVTDQSGAVVPQATISIKNLATGVQRDNTTNSAGFYVSPNLLPGTYEVRVEAQGFSSEVQTSVTLTVGEQQVLNFTLQVGQVSQTVEVTTEAPNIQLASSSISAVVNSTTVRELPLNGRSWTDLATLQPGVSAVQTQASFEAGPDRGKRSFGAQITVAGARPQQNNYRLDGITINDYDNGAPGSVLGGDLGVDAIQEFSVLTSNYSAEYGRTSGGVVNAITRSGTNQFHGSVYEFLRNSALDARNFFDGQIPPFRRNQFGGDAGGPIRKDKIFVFGDYEGIRQSKGITSLDTVPSNAARGIGPNGQPTVAQTCFVDPNALPGTACTPNTPLPGPGITNPNADPTTHIDRAVLQYLPFWPVANRGLQPGTNGDVGLFGFAAQQVVSENFFTTRSDIKLSERDSLAVTYLGDITHYSSPDGLDVISNSSTTNRQIGILEETHVISSSLVTSTRVGYSRDAVLNNVGTSAINPLGSDPSLAAVPGQFAAQVSVSALTNFTGGVKANGPGQFFWNSFQGYNDTFWTHGTHSLKFGVAAERMQLNMYQLSESSGTFTFETLTKFLLNQPKKFTAGLSDNPGVGLRQSLLGVYIQDDWRARPNLTLNIGLRWEMTTVPTEVHNKLSTLLNITDATPHLGSPLMSNPTLHNFDPRVGFAWDPFRNGKSAVRGGFGIFDVLPLISVYFPTTTVAPYHTTGFINACKGPTVPGCLPQGSFYSNAAGLFSSTSNAAAITDQHAHRSYDMQWNLNVQRELAPNLTAMAGYVGSRGVHLPFSVSDFDIVLPTPTPQGYLYPWPPSATSTLNPNFANIVGTHYEGNSYYHALEVGIQERMNHGVELQGSFTWGKSIDTGSATGIGDQFSNSIGSLPWYDLKAVRGLSDFNISRTLVISASWQVPSPKSLSGPAAWLANGWELGGIYKVSDGVPFTPTWGTDGDPQGLNSSDPWAFPNRLATPGCKSLINPGNPNNYIKTECFAVPTAPASFFTGPTPICSSDPRFGTDAVGDPTLFQCFNLRGNAGRNILIGPGTSELDFSVFKNHAIKKISENFNVQFRAEFFNILNHPNFAVPATPNNTDIFDSTGAPTGVAGLLTSTTTTAREIQFALKLGW
jgi:outer membrane receptor protein involved in Fe transport